MDKSTDDFKELNDSSFIEKLKELNINSTCTCNCHSKSTSSSLVDSSTQTSKFNLSSFESTTQTPSNDSIVTNGRTNNETNNNDVIIDGHCDDFKKPENGYTNGITTIAKLKKDNFMKCDFATQTLSTGDIVITKVFFNDGVTN